MRAVRRYTTREITCAQLAPSLATLCPRFAVCAPLVASLGGFFFRLQCRLLLVASAYPRIQTHTLFSHSLNTRSLLRGTASRASFYPLASLQRRSLSSSAPPLASSAALLTCCLPPLLPMYYMYLFTHTHATPPPSPLPPPAFIPRCQRLYLVAYAAAAALMSQIKLIYSAAPVPAIP
ncbi:hypothetical protein B0H14DRAFT_3525601 [Mycena olivaceomarginata]|nr:hypothetical protein B0H14DRAFT_3525601 [Mycena olivaceomarginata]